MVDMVASCGDLGPGQVGARRQPDEAVDSHDATPTPSTASGRGGMTHRPRRAIVCADQSIRSESCQPRNLILRSRRAQFRHVLWSWPTFSGLAGLPSWRPQTVITGFPPQTPLRSKTPTPCHHPTRGSWTARGRRGSDW
ncbi:hypothetical protein [Ornithinimicrobium kibberense]|uniref:hypothetical protein n=1 Tax=Ornithinimicrobium kibberense TaxID=282060 RepID=UPI003623420B